MKKTLIRIFGGAALLAVLWFIYNWLSAPALIGMININGGQAHFTHEDFEINILDAQAKSPLKIKKRPEVNNNEYSEFNAYSVEASTGDINGLWTIEYPIPKDILDKIKSEDDLKGRLFVMKESAFTGSFSNNKYLNKKEFIEPLIDWPNRKIIATIKFPSQVMSVGLSRPLKNNSFSLLSPLYGGHWDDVKDRFVWFGFSIRYYTGIGLKKYNSKHFKIYTSKAYNKDAVQLALDYLEDAYRIIENNLGLSFAGIKTPIQVEIMQKQQAKDGEFYSGAIGEGILELNGKYFGKNPNMLSQDEKQNLKVTCGHELLHLVQEYYRLVGKQDKPSLHWIDEATAIAAEPLFAKNPDFYFASLHAHANTFYKMPLLFSNNAKFSFIERQEFGYGAAYFLMYLAKIHPKKHLLFSRLYYDLNINNTISKSFKSNINLEKIWSDFWKTSFDNPDFIHKGFRLDFAFSLKAVHKKNEVGSPNFTFSSEPLFSKNISKTSSDAVQLDIKLDNLSAMPFLIQFPKTGDNELLYKDPKASFEISFDNTDNKVRIHLFKRLPKSKNWTYISTLHSKNLSKFNISDTKEVLLVAFNIDTDSELLTSRTLSIGVKIKNSYSYAKPVQNNRTEKELNNWIAYAAQQKKQQSNEYLTKYYTSKELELKQALHIYKTYQSDIYNEMSSSIKPDDPIELQRDLSGATMMMLDKSVKSKGNKSKFEQMSKSASGADRKMYADAARFFALRYEAIGHLLRYLAAAKAAKEIAKQNTNKEENKNTVKNTASAIGSWKISGSASGQIIVYPNGKLDVKLNGSLPCGRIEKGKDFKAVSTPVNINFKNIAYQGSGSYIFVNGGRDNVDYQVNSNEMIRLKLFADKGQLTINYFKMGQLNPICNTVLNIRK